MIDNNIRKLGIGGSDVAALFGADPYKDAFAVWAAKKGGVEQEPDDHMLVGSVLEPAVLDLYGRITRRDVEYCNITHQHPTRPFQVYSPDALVRGQRLGVEAKVAYGPERAAWGWEGEDVPTRVLFQVWYYMSAMDYPKWDVVALLGDGLPRIFTVERLDTLHEEVMLRRVEEWWLRYIVGDERPPFGDPDDAHRWLAKAYPTHKKPDMRDATPEEAVLLDEYVALSVTLRTANKKRDAIAVQIEDAIKNKEGLNWDGNAFTWRKTKDSQEVNWEALATGLLHGFVKDEEQRATLISMHTNTVAGFRRIHVNHPLLKQAKRGSASEVIAA